MEQPTDDSENERRIDFGSALRTAIQRSGLSLSEISRRLDERRTPVSASALSYWQNGDNQPERAGSLAAVAALEEILSQPPRTLTGLIGPRRPRGRWTPRAGAAVAYDKLWARPDAVARVLGKIDATPVDLERPQKLSHHVSYQVGPDGHEKSMRVRRLVRAEQDGTTRFVFVSRCNALSQPPAVVYTEGCKPGRFRADVPTSTCVYEFLFDRPLETGELASVEFGLRFPPGQTDQHARMALFRPAREMVLQIAFHPDLLPDRCYSFFQARSDERVEKRREVRFDPHTNTFQYITLDPPPGQYGVVWEWD
ncbi:multiprotein-bridging factor 1 family protein [Actinokineospora soli]|uniref:Multiprotein-bridging factor 1 family protein n=1 Tax=Actinokineospora soli TaxID=1048753 RepID=A0ABW2TL34_9PSEU